MDKESPGRLGLAVGASLLVVAALALAALCTFALLPQQALAGNPGSMDPTFGIRGVTGLAPEKWIMGPSGIAEGPDGSMVMSVLLVKQNAGEVIKFSAGGRLDPDFGDNGRVTLRFKSGSISPRDILVDRLGRILVGGGGRIFGFDEYGAAIARLTPQGEPDRSFAGDGLRVLEPGSFASPRAMVFARGGSVLTVGHVSGRPSKAEVVRYTNTGSLDRRFSGDGRKRIPMPRARSDHWIATDRVGRVVVASATGTDSRDFGPVAIRVDRLSENGRHDRSFSRDGKWSKKMTNDYGAVFDVTVDSRDRILVSASGNGGSVVTRIGSKGRLDRGFGDGGFATADRIFASSISVDGSGRINLVGEWGAAYFGNWSTVIRLKGNGKPDPTFRYKSGKVSSLRDHFLDDRDRIVATGMVDIGPGVVRILNP